MQLVVKSKTSFGLKADSLFEVYFFAGPQANYNIVIDMYLERPCKDYSATVYQSLGWLAQLWSRDTFEIQALPAFHWHLPTLGRCVMDQHPYFCQLAHMTLRKRNVDWRKIVVGRPVSWQVPIDVLVIRLF